MSCSTSFHSLILGRGHTVRFCSMPCNIRITLSRCFELNPSSFKADLVIPCAYSCAFRSTKLDGSLRSLPRPNKGFISAIVLLRLVACGGSDLDGEVTPDADGIVSTCMFVRLSNISQVASSEVRACIVLTTMTIDDNDDDD